MTWSREAAHRVRWRHLAGSPRAHEAATPSGGPLSVVPPAPGSPTSQPAPSGDGEIEEARTELAMVIAAFAETAFMTREQAERDAERIRREADAYAESRRAEAERVLEEARRHAAEGNRVVVDDERPPGE